MTTLTYKQAFDKITEAYIKGEIKPFDCEFCFCGTLSPNGCWHGISYLSAMRLPDSEYFYSIEEYGRMEAALFSKFPKVKQFAPGHLDYPGTIPEYLKMLGNRYEEILFKGMSAALDVLKKIHIERGEIIDETPAFTKRQLQTV